MSITKPQSMEPKDIDQMMKILLCLNLAIKISEKKGNDMYAVASSGGKDSTFAIYQALKKGFPITHIFHIYNPDTSRVRFHGYRPNMIERQAESMGLKIITMPTSSDKFDKDFKLALKKVKQNGLKGLVFGNISLEDVREFYKTRVESAKLEYYDILWKLSSKSVLKSFIKNGFKAVITSVWLKKLDRKYLGRQINKKFLLDIEKEKNVDICGENGEYHSLAYDGPCFKTPLPYKIDGIHEEKNNVFLDIKSVKE